ncbi:MAG TPA: PAS domain-containing protein [Chthoniobacteraceae bacterium]|nr:PAS domain-containing protein [Chthoniobacteraceae bacterium]
MGKDDAEGQRATGEERRGSRAFPHPIVIVDRVGEILFANDAWRSWLVKSGVDPAPYGVGMNYLDTFQNRVSATPPGRADVAVTRHLLEEVFQGEISRCSFEQTLACGQDGPRKSAPARLWVDANALPSDTGGAVLAHHVEEPPPPRARPLYQGRTFLKDLLAETGDGVFLCSPTGRLLLANPAMEPWLELPGREVIGKKIVGTLPEPIARLLLDRNDEVITSASTLTFETNVVTGRGMRTVLVTKGLHRTSAGRLKGVFGIVRDVSGVRAMEREIIDTSDKEKQRLGQELHENLCQYLVGISLLGNVLFEELLRLGLKQADDARQITSLVKEAITEVRSLVKGLSTLPLEQDEGLNDALRDLAEQARAIGRIRCSLRLPRRVNFADPSVEVHLFRIAQEAVHNAIKHAAASQLQISLANNQRAIVLSVKDNGIGFSGSRPVPSDAGSGLGLHIMHYRSRAIGAHLVIDRRPQGGTVVTCTVPKVPGRV